jgi:tellurite methyltransferase
MSCKHRAIRREAGKPRDSEKRPQVMSNPPTPDRPSSPRAWRDYYVATAGRPPRPTLLFALDRFAVPASGSPRPRRAVDLGCGDGRDTIELLRRAWSVTAIDAEPEAIARLRARADLPADAVLDARCADFAKVDGEEVDWGAVDLVNASFALPLCPPDTFPALWEKIGTSLVAGGRFAGQLYGPHDDWAKRTNENRALTIVDATAARGLLAAYTIELFEEEESDAVTPRGTAKHWHIFHVVARKG